MPGVVAHAWSPSTQKTEAGGFWVRCQPGLLRETLSQTEKKSNGQGNRTQLGISAPMARLFPFWKVSKKDYRLPQGFWQAKQWPHTHLGPILHSALRATSAVVFPKDYQYWSSALPPTHQHPHSAPFSDAPKATFPRLYLIHSRSMFLALRLKETWRDR
jgi:hypothetical protein